MTIPDIFSVSESAKVIGVSDQKVRQLLRNKQLVGKQIGKQWLIAKDDLIRYCETNMIASDLKEIKPKQLPSIKALSFFSGAMGLDQGLIQAGIPISFACENDKACQKTILANHPDIPLVGDIWKHSAKEIRLLLGLKKTDKIDVMVGGPPCQAFSTAGARRGFQDERGNAFLRYLELAMELKPSYLIIENVRGLLSAPLSHRPHSERGDEKPQLVRDEKPGGALYYILSVLRSNGYEVSFNLYNSANFGVPQIRERVILICYRGKSKVPHLMPTHSQDGSFGLPKWVTLKDALKDMSPNDQHYVLFPENRLKYYRLLTEGQYWKHLPEEIQKEALGNSYYSGGGKTGFLRRLAWDKPSCTLVTAPNMPATDICHPTEDRPLSIEEYKRVQQFPDDYEVCGSLKDQYRQIGNAVPVGLGVAVGKAILAHMKGENIVPPIGFPFSRYKGNDEVSWQEKVKKELDFDDTHDDLFLRASK